ncbi:unnamed protein product [Parajaminaea phylloscopi]
MRREEDAPSTVRFWTGGRKSSWPIEHSLSIFHRSALTVSDKRETGGDSDQPLSPLVGQSYARRDAVCQTPIGHRSWTWPSRSHDRRKARARENYAKRKERTPEKRAKEKQYRAINREHWSLDTKAARERNPYGHWWITTSSDTYDTQALTVGHRWAQRPAHLPSQEGSNGGRAGIRSRSARTGANLQAALV